MKNEELKVIRDYYDVMLYLTQRIEKFPRHHRYTLGADMERRLNQVLALLLKAKFRKEKVDYLSDANLELEILRFQARLAHDVRALPGGSLGHLSKLLDGVGVQVGGWLRSKAGPAP